MAIGDACEAGRIKVCCRRQYARRRIVWATESVIVCQLLMQRKAHSRFLPNIQLSSKIITRAVALDCILDYSIITVRQSLAISGPNYALNSTLMSLCTPCLTLVRKDPDLYYPISRDACETFQGSESCANA